MKNPETKKELNPELTPQAENQKKGTENNKNSATPFEKKDQNNENDKQAKSSAFPKGEKK